MAGCLQPKLWLSNAGHASTRAVNSKLSTKMKILNEEGTGFQRRMVNYDIARDINDVVRRKCVFIEGTRFACVISVCVKL